MFNWLSNITDHAQYLTQRLHHLLAPPGATCLTCGTRAVLSPLYPGICLRCVKLIPWIRSIRCLRCGRGVGCPDCARLHMQNRSFICNRSAVHYNALMKDWIGMYKFRGHERYAPLLTALLIQAFQAMSDERTAALVKEPSSPVAHPATFAQQPKPQWRPDAITYVPVSSERLAERGFNQAERLAVGLGTACRLPIVDLLQRQINTTKQSFKSRGERIETMKNAFSINPDGIQFIEELYRESYLPTQKGMSHARAIQILLIDDIYTTGSTLDACGRVILNAAFSMEIPVEIYTLTLARS
ncbi:ComF family protein [Paenibacillus sp. PCH8]|uniref:ComF family protein n=1 Tax=Paenibacillus sp. PCH8 TaxID=2066524 RepID=UPI000CF94CB4|nr:ComF family protein [Paenibacillus sp. PCH8]PQP84578.1 ComF family protein [Paenibacillus sp. PCH8]